MYFVTAIYDAPYMQRLSDTSFQPVFILGLPRSGTTILYRILDKTGQFNVVTLYHVLYHDRLLEHHFNGGADAAIQEITDYFQRHDVETREADSLSVGPRQPTEYGFMLPERGFPWNITEQNSGRIAGLCKKISYIEDNGRQILLKNPFDFANFMRIKTIFPQAQFIFIHRHPVDVLDSQMRGIRQIFREKNDYLALIFNMYGAAYDNPLTRWLFRMSFSPYVPLGLLYLMQRVAHTAQYYVEHINELPREDYVSITYEHLCRRPRDTIAHILDHFGLDASFDAGQYIQPRDTETPPQIRALDSRIYNQTKRYNQLLGYSSVSQRRE